MHIHGIALVISFAVSKAFIKIDERMFHSAPLVAHDVEEVDWVESKVGPNSENIPSRIEWGRVVLVKLLIELIIDDYLLNIERGSVVRKRGGGVDRQVPGIIHVGVVDSQNDESTEDATDVHCARSEKWLSQGSIRRRGNVPVKGRNRVKQAQSES